MNDEEVDVAIREFHVHIGRMLHRRMESLSEWPFKTTMERDPDIDRLFAEHGLEVEWLCTPPAPHLREDHIVGGTQ